MKKSLTLSLLFIFFLSHAQQELLYISTESGNFDIYKLSLETGKSEQLTDNKGWDWSPKYISGKEVVFYYSTDTIKNFGYKLMNLKGVQQEVEVPDGENMLPSPDGRYFTFTSRSGDNQYIFIYDMVSGSSKKAVSYNCYNGRVCWKRDGTGFAFISDRDGSNEVYYYGLADGQLKRLTNDEKRQKYLAWSPDGQFIAFSDEISDTSNQISIMDLATGEVMAITEPEFVESELAWSPDGGSIAFHSNRDQGDQIYLIDVNSKKIRQLTQAKAYHGEPEWVNN